MIAGASETSVLAEHGIGFALADLNVQLPHAKAGLTIAKATVGEGETGEGKAGDEAQLQRYEAVVEELRRSGVKPWFKGEEATEEVKPRDGNPLDVYLAALQVLRTKEKSARLTALETRLKGLHAWHEGVVKQRQGMMEEREQLRQTLVEADLEWQKQLWEEEAKATKEKVTKLAAEEYAKLKAAQEAAAE